MRIIIKNIISFFLALFYIIPVTIIKLITSYLAFIPHLIIVFIIRPAITVFGKFYREHRWNGGICQKCSTKWTLYSYNSDAIFKDKWRCGCGSTFFSTVEYEELTVTQEKEKMRESKLKKLKI